MNHPFQKWSDTSTSSGISSSSTSNRCQECGNQAKKACGYMRCRSCCRNQGFHCQTHVKSTWVPVARRPQYSRLQNQQQQQYFPTTAHDHPQEQLDLQVPAPNPKRLRENPSSSSGQEMGNFPAELQMPAIFRCVRVSSIDNAVDQYAYQTTVEIGGHIFKGILYDQGSKEESSSQLPNLVVTTGFTPALTRPSNTGRCNWSPGD